MRVIGINGSPRIIGNTSTALNIVLDELEKEGIETEHIQLFSRDLLACNACMSCSLRGDGRCINENDALNEYLDKILEADGIILATPVYYGNMTSMMKIFLERIGLPSKYANNQLRRKVGAVIAVQGRQGGLSVHGDLVNFLLENQMVVCPSSGCVVVTAEKPSDLEKDKLGIKLLQDQGREMAWLLQALRGSDD